MGRTAENLQSKASELVELANAFEQSAMNQRWSECYGIFAKLTNLQYGVLANFNDLDSRTAIQLGRTLASDMVECVSHMTEETATRTSKQPELKGKK